MEDPIDVVKMQLRQERLKKISEYTTRASEALSVGLARVSEEICPGKSYWADYLLCRRKISEQIDLLMDDR